MTRPALLNKQTLIDLIDAELASETDQNIRFGLNRARDLIWAEPVTVPKIVANISGGILQGASADAHVELYALDFDTEGGKPDVEIEGSEAFLYELVPTYDPDFVEEVMEANEEREE